MKSWTVRFKAVDRKNFEEVRDGSKPIETRAATVKYQPIEVGDTLIFVCENDKFSRRIKTKRHFKSIDEMIKVIPFQEIMPSVASIEEMKKAYASYSGYEEKIKEFGLFAFELEEC